MASYNPACSLGLQHKTGSILPGKLADLVVLDDDYAVLQTYCMGEAKL
jgi:N-acetylglucosamine-6-phosphate deacetylase